MKVGDLIAKKDMHSTLYKIKGGNIKDANLWDIELFSQAKGVTKTGMIAKNDEHWKVVAYSAEGNNETGDIRDNRKS